MVIVGELGLKVTKHYKQRNAEGQNSPHVDKMIFIFFNVSDITSKGKNPIGIIYLHTLTRQSKATAQRSSSKKKLTW